MYKVALASILALLSFTANAELSNNCSSLYVNGRTDNTKRVVSCDAKEWFEANYGKEVSSDDFVSILITSMTGGGKIDDKYVEPIKKYQLSQSFAESLAFTYENIKSNKSVQEAKEKADTARKNYEYAKDREEALMAISADPRLSYEVEQKVINYIGHNKSKKGFDDLNSKIDSYEARLVKMKINEEISKKVEEYISIKK